MLNLTKTFVGLQVEVECPGEAGVEPGGERVELNGRPQQCDGFGEALAAECEHGADAGDPWVVGQIGSEREVPKGRGKVAIEMEVDPGSGGEDLRCRSGEIGNGIGGTVHELGGNGGRHIPIEGLSDGEVREVDFSG